MLRATFAPPPASVGPVVVVASLYSEFIADAGAAAASMAIGGFVGQAMPAIKGGAEQELRYGATVGGLIGHVLWQLVSLFCLHLRSNVQIVTANKAVAIGFAIATAVGWTIIAVLRLVLDANGQVMAIAVILLIVIFSPSLSELHVRFSSRERR